MKPYKRLRGVIFLLYSWKLSECRGGELLQFLILRLGLFQDGDVGVGVIPRYPEFTFDLEDRRHSNLAGVC